MECRAAVKGFRHILAVVLLALAAAPAPAAQRVLVLIAASNSPADHLDPVEIRKLFLGVPVLRNSLPLRPVCNTSDGRIQEVFLQYVVAMSQSAYDRRILSLVNTQGRPRPLELRSREAVITTISADPQAVSYAWLSDVAGNPRIRVLRVLWRE
jgi:hypothetical protein